MKNPDDVKLSRDDGEALIARLNADKLSSDDRRLLVKLIELYFWLTVALQETTISLSRLKQLLFGHGAKPSYRKKGGDDEDDSSGGPPSGTSSVSNYPLTEWY